MISFTYSLKTYKNREQDDRCEGLRKGGWYDVGERVQTTSIKMNKFGGHNVQHGDQSESTVL